MEACLTKAFGKIDPRKHLRSAEVNDLLRHLIPVPYQRQRTFYDIVTMNDGTEKRMKDIRFLVTLGASSQVATELVFARKNVRKTNRLE